MLSSAAQLIICIALFLSSASLKAEPVKVAVASNFMSPMKALVEKYAEINKHPVQLSFASSGKLYAQIRHGAPYDFLFSADQEIPEKLIIEGLAKPHMRFTYAVGSLVLISNKENLPAEPKLFSKSGFKKIAIANPRFAPYGRAAYEVLENLELKQSIEKKIVKGENISQVAQYFTSGNVDLAFVAQSQLNDISGVNSSWLIPKHLHSAILQDAVLLRKSESKPEAKAFFDFLKSKTAQNIIVNFGYRLDTGS